MLQTTASPEVIYPGVDKVLSFTSNELNSLTLLTFAAGADTYASSYHILHDWQDGSTVGQADVKRETHRQRGLQAVSYGFLDAIPRPNGWPQLEITEEGVVASAVAGHMLATISVGHNVNLSNVFGKTTNEAAVLDDTSPRLSPALTRSLILMGMLRALDSDQPLTRLRDIRERLAMTDIELKDEAFIEHVEALHSTGHLERRKKRSDPTRDYYTLDGASVDFVTDLRDIVTKLHTVDDDWVDFISEGLGKAKDIQRDHSVVAQLIRKRMFASQESYSMNPTETRHAAIEFGRKQDVFSSGDFNDFLGGNYSPQYVSNKIRRLVDQGVLVKIPHKAPKLVRYKLAEKYKKPARTSGD